MAFHQATRPAVQRALRVDVQAEPDIITDAPHGVDDSQTWVVFSPMTDAATTTTSYLSSLHEANDTPGRSRISDFGSLQTVARSDLDTQPATSAVHLSAPSVDLQQDGTEDDAELDSLDSHLPEFRSNPHLHSSATVLPAHDGLGSFRLDTAALASDMQDRMYAFEQYNPRRVRRRLDGSGPTHLEADDGQPGEMDRNRRIEAWRLDQSKVFLEEIEKQTKRRREGNISLNGSQARRNGLQPVSGHETTEAPEATMRGAESTWHDEDAVVAEDDEDLSLWARITRRFMRDFMGIDDEMLSVLIGESLPADDDLSSTPKASMAHAPSTPSEESSLDDSSWHVRLMERVARELGLLVHHVSPHPHPGAFSTYARMQAMPLPYAGLPVIPETTTSITSTAHRQLDASSADVPAFRPTVNTVSPMNIPGRATDVSTQSQPRHPSDQVAPESTFSQHEWEQNLDISLVFRYLRSRFSTRPSSTSGGISSHPLPNTGQEASAKAARVRQHHPLIGRSRQIDRRTFRVTTPSSPAAIRHASSCASQSTKRSARRNSLSSRHSSRHYWDLGGSVGTGSMIASAGPMGSWGEV